MYAQLEAARTAAAAGDFGAARSGYARVDADVRRVAACVADAELASSFAQFLGALQEERELTAAWEAECAELAAWADEQARSGRGRGLGTEHFQSSVTSPPVLPAPVQPCTPPAPAPGGRAGAPHHAGPSAFSVDPQSFEVQALARPPAPASATPPPRDGDVWSPPEPPGSSTAPSGGRPLGRRERTEAYEQQRRQSVSSSAPACVGRGQGCRWPCLCCLSS